MTKSGSLARILVVAAALCAPSNAFAPQPVAVSKATATSKSIANQPTALNVWNPFVKQEEAPAVIEVVKEDPVPGPFETKNYIAAGVLATLVTFSFLLAPGELNSPADTEMVNLLVSNPYPRPEGLNELWFGIWNCFTVVPAVIAALEAPVGRGQRLPAAPFLWASAGLGYFALGPYFATRTVRDEAPDLEDMGFASRNIFESKIFGALVSAIAISIPFSSGLIGCDFSSTLAGYIDLATSSRFVAVASADITILSVLAGVLVSEDATRRGWEDKSLPLLAASILFPVVGPSLYLVARPSLKEE